jgi:short-subunit dehydrogenase
MGKSLNTVLAGGVAVVTGAGSGIGRALAVRLARKEMSVALADIDPGGLRETAEQLSRMRAAVSTHVVDVADPAQVEALARDVAERYGRVTLLVNNAGVALFGTVQEVSIEEIDWLMRINFFGTVYGVKYFLPVLERQEAAYIVNLSSIFGILAVPGEAAYAASKFAVRGFTEALEQELAGTSIRVLSVLPGRVPTKIGQRARARRGLADVFESETLGTPAEVVADRIVKGIVRGDRRILVGPDAVWLERLQRAFPVRYPKILGYLRNLKK